MILQLSLIGIFLFILCFLIAVYLYPGGSIENSEAIGFCWNSNFWCDLIRPIAKNGLENVASPFGLASLISLCGACILIFMRIDSLFSIVRYKKTMKSLGLFSILSASAVFTPLHHVAIILSGASGVIPLMWLYHYLYTNREFTLLSFGALSFILMGTSFILFITVEYIPIMPELEHVTIIVFTIWVIMINFKLLKIS
jgi:hypothetical protein